MEEHISSAFDKDLGEIEQLVVRMGGLVEDQIESAVKVLLTLDTELAPEVRASDKKVDELEAEIADKVVRLIALRQPTAQDLRIVLATLKIASDLERIGDHAKNIAKRTHVLAQLEPVGESSKTIERMCVMVRRMVKDALDSYIKRDADAADKIRASDEEVDQVYNNLFRALLTYMMEDARRITPCMHLLFIAKNVERMGDHITSITEQVHFFVHGELPPDERPKGDVTSTTLIDPSDSDSGKSG